MYNNSSHPYAPPGYENSYQYPYGNNYAYQGYGYQTQQDQQQSQQSGGYQWNQSYPQQTSTTPPKDGSKQEVQSEIQHQNATLTKQREDYVRKAMVLKRELDQLKTQKQELAQDDRSEKELKSILKGNDKLQDEINAKLKAILNVVEMLSQIIKDGKSFSNLEKEMEVAQATPPAAKNGSQESESSEKKYCYVYYDTGTHWCRSCDKFPETAKEFLQHLHSEEHQDQAKESEVDMTPWHKLPKEELMPSFEDAPKKRVPIKGLQFFMAAPSWYCKLCDVWIGDLHCASLHLKSKIHSQNYEIFVKQNPHWEKEWLRDREAAVTRKSSDDKKRPAKDKKKKKKSKKRRKKSSDDSSSSSSSSSSESSSEEEEEEDDTDRAKSIRVAMRNMQQVKNIMEEDLGPWAALEKLIDDVRRIEGHKDKPDELINQWMTVQNPVPEKEKNVLENIKERMRQKQEVEKAKQAELDRKKKEKEEELHEKKKKQQKEEMEKAEREKKRKEDVSRLDKDRGHVKFKTSREHTRKRRSPSEEDKSRSRKEREESPQFRPRRPTNEREPTPEKESYSSDKRRPPGPPSYKKLPFIGRMPLFKRKNDKGNEKHKEPVQAEAYEPRRKTRFETGNLTKAFIPKPDVVCFPVLSSIPPIMAPPPEPPQIYNEPKPEPPKEKPPTPKKQPQPLPPPPPAPPMIEEEQYDEGSYYQMYQDSPYEEAVHPPLEPPPLPPDDDLAMLGICADDMAAQSF